MVPDFAQRIILWQSKFGRHGLPWQSTQAKPDPYPIWLSEVMLQQTQVETVVPYFLRFLKSFPTIPSLAAASEDQVLAHWSGLGYYSRARNLHAAARKIMAEHGGEFPQDAAVIQSLPGIGRSTAAAIAAFSYDEPLAILDGNVKRVLTRVFGVEGWPGDARVEARLWALAESLRPTQGIRPYTQGIMDLGATVCTRGKPKCLVCPFSQECVAHREGRYKELPGPRPKKALPEREASLLVLIHAAEVLLERRPAPGIWGGLWSLPECLPGESPAEAAARQGYGADDFKAVPGLVHGFTHFRLKITPWRFNVSRPLGADEPTRLWLPLAEIDGAALPTPIRRILAALD